MIRFIYLDTNILSAISQDSELFNNLRKLIKRENLVLSISAAQLLELVDANRLHDNLIKRIYELPSRIILHWHEIFNREIKSHPNNYQDSIVYSRVLDIPRERFHFLIESKILKDERASQKKLSNSMNERHFELKNNFAPSKSGKYVKSQSKEFMDLLSIQWLGSIDLDFLKQYENDISSLNLTVFKTVQIISLIIFYKYYLGNRNPNGKSDFGDLFHLPYIPYCKKVIMENDLTNILNQVKRNSEILNSVQFENIKYLRSYN